MRGFRETGPWSVTIYSAFHSTKISGNFGLKPWPNEVASRRKFSTTNESPVVDREKLKQTQRDHESLQKYWEKDDVVVRGQAENSFEVKGLVLYCVYKHPNVNGGIKTSEASHGSCAVEKPNNGTSSWIDHGRSMGIKKTTDNIQSAFYWPGIQGDVTCYCKSCDVCQKTVNKGSAPKVPLEKMPLIDKPFKRVAIDLVGPISPPSEAGQDIS